MAMDAELLARCIALIEARFKKHTPSPGELGLLCRTAEGRRIAWIYLDQITKDLVTDFLHRIAAQGGYFRRSELIALWRIYLTDNPYRQYISLRRFGGALKSRGIEVIGAHYHGIQLCT